MKAKCPIAEAVYDLITAYNTFMDDPYIRNPVARALYVTWRKYDLKDSERREASE